MTTNALSNTPSLAQIMSCVQQVEGQLEVTVGHEATETTNIGNSQVTIAKQQLSDVEAYNKDADKTCDVAIGIAVLSSIGSGLGAGLGFGFSVPVQAAVTGVSVLSQVGAGSLDCFQAKMSLDQGDLSAQQQLYTGAGSTLGQVATSSQDVGGNVIQGITSITQDINAMLAQENQASNYKG